MKLFEDPPFQYLADGREPERVKGETPGATSGRT